MTPHTSEDAPGPAALPGVFEHCDRWCDYCTVTSQCPACRRPGDPDARRGPDAFRRLDDLVEFARDIAAEEGRMSPDLRALRSSDPAVPASVSSVDDPLDDLAWRYTFEAARFLEHRHWLPPVCPSPQPSPLDVVAWYHVLINMRLGRALASAIQARRGMADRAMDANGCAKMVLVAIDRSHASLRRLRGWRDDARVVMLLETLEQLSRGVEGRFPSARGFIRPGLDGPVA